ISGADLQGRPLVAGPVPNPWDFRTECPLGAPHGLQVRRLEPDTVSLSWQPVPQASAYEVFESSNRFAPFPSGWTVLAVTSLTLYAVAGHLTDGYTHYYLVRATDGFQDGPNSTVGVKASLSFAPNPAGTSVAWFSLPYNSTYARASDIASE